MHNFVFVFTFVLSFPCGSFLPQIFLDVFIERLAYLCEFRGLRKLIIDFPLIAGYIRDQQC